MKYLQMLQIRPNRYFWRTHDGQEMDCLEEYDGKLNAYKFKWLIKKKKVPAAFARAYPKAEVKWMDRNNFESFVG